jgi:hypothetical protein
MTERMSDAEIGRGYVYLAPPMAPDDHDPVAVGALFS